MDPNRDEARDYADRFPLSGRDMEEDNQILTTLLERIPSCKTASDIDQLLQDIPVLPPVVVPVRTVQEAVAAMISHMISCCAQDCVVLLVPYPNNPNQVESFNITTDFDVQGDGLVWYARPQLFFNCTLCPTGAKGPGYRALAHQREQDQGSRD